MRLLLNVVSVTLGLFSLLTSSKITFLERFLKMLITEEIWSHLCLKKAKKKIGISAQQCADFCQNCMMVLCTMGTEFPGNSP